MPVFKYPGGTNDFCEPGECTSPSQVDLGALLALSCLHAQEEPAIGQTPQAAASGNHGRRFSHVRDIQTTEWSIFPGWAGGMLIGYLKNESNGPIIFTVDREGRRTETLFTIPGGNYIELMNTSARETGELVILGHALTADGSRPPLSQRFPQTELIKQWPGSGPMCLMLSRWLPTATFGPLVW